MQQDNSPKEQNRPVTEEQDQKAMASNSSMDEEKIAAAHNQAEQDMEDDAEFTASSPNDDLDEGETARLGEDSTSLI